MGVQANHSLGEDQMKKNTIRTLIAVGTASLALVAASPASAQDAKPLDPDGKPMCSKTTSDGETRWFRQGETIKETDVDGKTTRSSAAPTASGLWCPRPGEPHRDVRRHLRHVRDLPGRHDRDIRRLRLDRPDREARPGASVAGPRCRDRSPRRLVSPGLPPVRGRPRCEASPRVAWPRRPGIHPPHLRPPDGRETGRWFESIRSYRR